MTTKEIFNEMQKRMDGSPTKLVGMKAVYQFYISEADSGVCSVAIADGKGVVTEGPHASPGITITVTSDDFADLVSGKLNGITVLWGVRLR
jgi:putative sterol carrier protein